jgi:hypothetical protein
MKKITENLPVLSIGLLLFSLFRLLLYYSVFNINIIDYVDIGEIISLSLASYIPAIFMVSLIILAVYFAQDSELLSVHNPERFLKIQAPESVFKRFYSFVNDIGKYNAFVPFLGYFIGAVLYYDKQETAIGVLIISTFFFVNTYYNFLILEVSRKKKSLTGTGLSTLTSNAIKITMLVTYITYFYTYVDATVKIRDTSYKNVTVGMSGKIIKSSNKFRYIGKTKDYIFFYQTDKKLGKVYSLDKVDSLYIE